MIAMHLDAIERLRTYRERSALFALLNLNRVKEQTELAVRRADDFLRSQADIQLKRQSELYEQTLGVPLAPLELEGMQARIQRESMAVAAFAEQCGKLRRVAEEAASTAERARIKHSALLRAKKKWDEVRRRYADLAEAADVRQEDVFFEDSTLSKQGRWR
jgi:hypothetical protein